MIDRLAFLWPEIAMFSATCLVMIMGLSPRREVRKACAWVCGLGLIAAGILAWRTTPLLGLGQAEKGQLLLPGIVSFVKVLTSAVGLMLLMLVAGSVDREEETAIAVGRARFDPLRSNRAEFYSFFMFSLTGLMLCASADDLIWLFLALELTSLPTYIMVIIARGSGSRGQSQEAGVKYFFLGALGAAVFLFGFALIYGGTGSTNLNQIHDAFMLNGLSPIALAGLMLSLLGVSFKIAAVPMHFYTPDVYQGAASQVSAFLAFVPKTAGFVAILLLCATPGWVWSPGASVFTAPMEAGGSLPEPLRLMLWVVAALTMTVGNVLAIWQSSVKRILAYSSIAHSGYMLVGVIVGPGDGSFTGSGVSAVLFYLLCYGVMNLGTFAVLACLERVNKDGELQEIDDIADIRGLCQTRPLLGWTMAVCSLSLLGFPPLLGFLGKLPLFTSAISAGEIVLVIVLGVNSAIAAFYYLRLFGAVALEKPDPTARPLSPVPFMSRPLAGLLSAAGALLLVLLVGNLLMEKSGAAARPAIGTLGRGTLHQPAAPPAATAPRASVPAGGAH